MNKLFKRFPEIIAFPILIIAYFATRLFNILSLPIFTDEAIYTRWAQIAKYDSAWRFISLTDGKQPSFMWAQMIMLKFVDDPLLAGRMVSVFAGFISLLGIYFLTSEIFKTKEKNKSRIIGLIASTIFIFFPFALLYDRLGIYESLTAAFFIWALYFQILLVKYIRLDLAMILGAILGGSVLTKSSGFLSIYMMPFLLVLFPFKGDDRKSKLIKLIVYFVVAVVIANIMYAILRLSPFFHIIEEKNSNFVYPVSEWMKFRFVDKIHNFVSNFKGLWDWFFIYFTAPYIVLALVSFAINKKFWREKIVLLLWFLLPFVAMCIFGKTLYPRYILFMVMPLIPLVAYSIYSIFDRYKSILVRGILLIIISFIPLRQMYFILFDIAHAPIPKLDLEQFINGWPAGGGVSESIEFFKEEARKGPIFVGTQGTFGLMPASLEIYLIDNKNITLRGYWPTNEQMPEELLSVAKQKPTYIIFYQDCIHCKSPGVAPATWPLEKVRSYKKGIGKTELTIYKVIPRK